MAIKGKKRELFDEQPLYAGLFEARVIAINPTASEFEEITGYSPGEDSRRFEYLSESNDGNTMLRLDIWLQETKERQRMRLTQEMDSNGDVIDKWIPYGDPLFEKFKVSLFLEDKVRVNMSETRTQYINSLGTTAWADGSDNLMNWFKERDYREAYTGEEYLYKFVRTWLSKLDYLSEETVVDLNWKRLMKGDVRELTNEIDGELCDSILALATVETRDTDNGVKEYQKIYNRNFISPYYLKFFNLVNYKDEEEIRKLRIREQVYNETVVELRKTGDKLKSFERFVLELNHEKYGCRDYFTLKEMQLYNPSDNICSGDEVMSNTNPNF